MKTQRHLESTVSDSTRNEVVAYKGKLGQAGTLFMLLIFAGVPFYVLGGIPSAGAQPNGSVYFTSILATHGNGSRELINGGPAKVYYGWNPVYVNLTFHNVDCSMAFGSRFQVQVVSVWAGLLTIVGSSLNMSVAEGSDGHVSFNMCNLTCGSCAQPYSYSIWKDLNESLSQPLIINLRIFYLTNQATNIEEDKTITMTVIRDLINMTQDACKIERGKNGTLSLRLRNLDDDYVSNTNVTLTDSAVFELSPSRRELNDIAGTMSATTTFNVSVPDTVEEASYNVTLQVTYVDFSGVSHLETKTAVISVEGESSMIYVLIAVAVVGGIVGLLLLLMVKKRGWRPAPLAERNRKLANR